MEVLGFFHNSEVFFTNIEEYVMVHRNIFIMSGFHCWGSSLSEVYPFQNVYGGPTSGCCELLVTVS